MNNENQQFCQFLLQYREFVIDQVTQQFALTYMKEHLLQHWNIPMSVDFLSALAIVTLNGDSIQKHCSIFNLYCFLNQIRIKKGIIPTYVKPPISYFSETPN